MTNRDGTGPNGQGARSGRGMGNCAGQGGTGIGRRLGRGGGQGRGAGRGQGRRSGLGYSSQKKSWIESLQATIEKLTEQLDKINKE